MKMKIQHIKIYVCKYHSTYGKFYKIELPYQNRKRVSKNYLSFPFKKIEKGEENKVSVIKEIIKSEKKNQ